MSAFIEAEVRRFLANNRLNETGLRELDTRIRFESYLREKKDAIAQDRKEGIDVEDAKSHTSQVQQKYDAVNDALAEARASREAASIR